MEFPSGMVSHHLKNARGMKFNNRIVCNPSSYNAADWKLYRYAVHLPAMIIPNQSTMEAKPTIFARQGRIAASSHSATLGYTLAWKYQTFKPVNTSITALSRNDKVL